ncbi:MAG: 30S ribosomal protein S8 [Candidatus Omnitrophota bacterium]
MSLTDPIADALTVLRNANMARKADAEVKASKLIGEILRIFKQEGFIKDFRFMEDKKQGSFKVYLKYVEENTPAITGIKRISTPGLRRYVNKEDIPSVYSGLGISILSTSKGILTDEEARQLNIGGEVLCHIW